MDHAAPWHARRTWAGVSFEGGEERGNGPAAAIVERAQCGEPRRGGQQLMGDIERQHRDRDTTVEDDGRGVRVDMDIELGGGGHIPEFETSASHDDEFADPTGNLRRLDQRHRDIGQRPRKRTR